jgi:hypothetical protein
MMKTIEGCNITPLSYLVSCVLRYFYVIALGEPQNLRTQKFFSTRF